jgi:hypothetical protein
LSRTLPRNLRVPGGGRLRPFADARTILTAMTCRTRRFPPRAGAARHADSGGRLSVGASVAPRVFWDSEPKDRRVRWSASPRCARSPDPVMGASRSKTGFEAVRGVGGSPPASDGGLLRVPTGARACRRCINAVVQRRREENPEKAASYNLARRVKHEPRPCIECGEQFVPGCSDTLVCKDLCRWRRSRRQRNAT